MKRHAQVDFLAHFRYSPGVPTSREDHVSPHKKATRSKIIKGWESLLRTAVTFLYKRFSSTHYMCVFVGNFSRNLLNHNQGKVVTKIARSRNLR